MNEFYRHKPKAHASPGDDQAKPASLLATDPFFAGIPAVAAPHGVRRVSRAFNANVFAARDLVDTAAARAAEIEADADSMAAAAQARGEAAGREEAQRELARELHRLEQRAETFFRDSEAIVMELALEVARRFVALNMSDAAARRITIDTIRKHAASQPYAIHVGVGARANVIAALEELKRAHPGMRLPIVKTDQRLGDDRAILMTRFGTADLDVESQLAALAEQALDGLPAAHARGRELK